MFITLTCPSYGRVGPDGTPIEPGSYDYRQAARDALHFAALFDRFIQNLRRFLGYDVQYFAAVEPQRRLAPHIHIAIRGTLSRTELRQVLAATYHQVWWPPADQIRHDDAHLPVWHDASGVPRPATGEFLPTWDEALDAIGGEEEPLHVARFGPRFDAQGVLAGSRDASKCIGYLVKYLTKHLADCHGAQTGAQHAHAERLADALGTSRARRRARTGYGTASLPRTRTQACGQDAATARPTAASTSATQADGSWSPANGPARPLPTTAPTAKPGSWPCWGSRQPTPAGTPGNPSPPATPTTCHPPSDSCTSSPTGNAGTQHSPKHEPEPTASKAPIFRQLGGRPDGKQRRHHRC